MDTESTQTQVVPQPRGKATARRDATSRVRRAVVFGIVAPLVCLALDPCVFRSAGPFGDSLLGPPLLGAYAVAAYLLIPIAVLALIAWLRQPRWGVWLAGPLLVGGLAATAIAICILPLALPAALIGVGLLGLLPIGTAWVYLRAGWRALFLVPRARRARAWTLTLLLGLLTAGLPLLAQHLVDRRTHALVDAALRGARAGIDQAVSDLEPFGWLADLEIPLRAFESVGRSSPAGDRLTRAWSKAGGAPLVDPFD